MIGRKGWLFSDTVKGAIASANLYSIVETAKANGFEPHAYLSLLFAQLPHAKRYVMMAGINIVNCMAYAEIKSGLN